MPEHTRLGECNVCRGILRSTVTIERGCTLIPIGSERFETEGLVYISRTSSWVPPSECLWDSPVLIRGKSLICQSYPEELKPFFLEHLRIAPASLNTLVDELLSIEIQHLPIARVKQLIWAVNEMKPKSADLNILLTCKFLPVRGLQRGAGTEIELRSSQSDFVIVDRSKVARIFEDDLEFLDFSLEEILQLKPFLRAMGLSDKYLSKLYSEETDCQGESMLDSRLTADFNSRAYELLR